MAMRRSGGLLVLALLILATPGRADLGEKTWEGPPPVEVVTFTARDTCSPSVSDWPDSVSGTVARPRILQVTDARERSPRTGGRGGSTRWSLSPPGADS